MSVIPILNQYPKKCPEAGVQGQTVRDTAKPAKDFFSSVYETLKSAAEDELPGAIKDFEGKDKELPEEPPEAEPDLLFAAAGLTFPGPESILSNQGQIIPMELLGETAKAAASVNTKEAAELPNESVISILEGNIKDIGPILEEPVTAQDSGAEALQDPRAGTVARMPQGIQISSQTAQNGTQAVPANGESDNLCPLENGNESAPVSFSVPESGTGEVKETERAGAGSRSEETFGTDGIPAQQVQELGAQKVQSAIKLEEAAHNSPNQATTETLFDKMVEKIEFMRSDESDSMSIQLKPEFLGKVSIQLSVGDQGLQVKILTEDSGIKNLIGAQINQLAETLADRGVKVSDIDVVYGGISDQSYSQSQTRQEPQRKSGSRSGIIGHGVIQETLPLSLWDENGLAALDPAISSMEFRA